MKRNLAIVFVLVLLIATLALTSCNNGQHVHIFETVVVKQTCSDQGYTQNVCVECGYICYDNYVEADSVTHSFVEVETIDSTCTNFGYIKYSCELCSKTIYDIIQPKHTFGEWEVTVPETCDENGVENNKCQFCDYVDTREIPAHHFWDEGVVTDPDCTNAGFTTYTCTACEKNMVEAGPEATGHAMGESYVNVAPTCTVDGEERKDCANCDYYESVVIAAGHDETKTIVVVTDPTCTSVGYTTYTCSECDYYEVGDYVEELPHDYTEWTTLVEPTCIDTGLKKGVCACGAEVTESIDVIPHEYDSVTVVDPTETATGYTIHSCYCGAFYVDTFVSTAGSEGLKFVEGTVSLGDCESSVIVVPLDKEGVAITTIGYKGFCNNETITTVYLTTNITEFSSAAFAYCDNLKTFNYEGTMEQWNAIVKGENWDLGLTDYVVNCTDGVITK